MWDSTNATHTYASAGVYNVSISGTIQGFRFNDGGDKLKITDISQWGVLNVGNSNRYFYGCSNLDVSATDALNLSGTTDLSYMFYSASSFNGNLSAWDTSSVTSMSNMFGSASSFNQDLSAWDTSSVTSMSNMFNSASAFNGNLSAWDTSSVTDMSYMFYLASSFNGNLSNWDTSSVTTMYFMFYSASSFNGNISTWDTSSVTTMYNMFYYASSFNGNLSTWDTSSVTDMSNMFRSAPSFNQNLSTWDTSSVTGMGYMFYSASSFNQDLSTWDISSVTTMNEMFRSASSFNGNLSAWDTSSVTTMSQMFYSAPSFNGNISNWDTSSVTDMSSMFYSASSFNQNIGNWNVSAVTDMASMFEDVTLSTANYDSLLIGWAGLPSLQNDTAFHGGNSKYCSGNSGRNDTLIGTYNWAVTDGGVDPSCEFVAPALTINSPLSQTYSTASILFNVTATDTTGVDSCWYSLDSGTNISMTNIGDDWNATNTSMTDGSHTANFYCNDLFGNSNDTESVSFVVDITAPSLTNVVYDSNVDVNEGDTIVTINASDYIMGVDKVVIEENSSGSYVNYTMSLESGNQFSGIYNYSLSYTTLEKIYFKIYANDTAGYMGNTSDYVIKVQDLSASINLDDYVVNSQQNITVSGKAVLLPDGTNVTGRNVSIWIDGLFEANATTDPSGNYNYTIAAPDTVGTRTVKANLTNPNGIYTENQTTFEVWAQTKVNYTTTTDYTKGENTEHNITGNYWRTDTNQPIQGLINITLSNATYSISKTCTGQVQCLKTFTIGPTGDLRGGNYTVNITAENSSAYYFTNSTQYNTSLEEPATAGTFNTPTKYIYDFVYGIEYSFLHNLTLNNIGKASMNNATIYNITLPSKIKSIVLTDNCSEITAPNTSCLFTFNITTTATASGTATINWRTDWTDNNNTLSYLLNSSQVIIQGNPVMNVSLTSINITENLSESKIFYTNVTNIGNLLLTNVGANKPYADWMEYTSTKDNGEGWDGQYWAQIYLGDYHTMMINITLNNFTEAYYDTTINFTNTQGNLEIINLTIDVRPNITASTDTITADYSLSSAPTLNFNVNATGNCPITNVSVSLVNNTMPDEWITFNSTGTWQNDNWARINEDTAGLLNITVNVTDVTEAIYTGIIYIWTNESISAEVNLTINVSPILTTPQAIYIQGPHNNITTYNLQLNSTGTIKLVNLSVSYIDETLPASWVEMTPTFISEIIENTQESIEINVTVPEFTDPGNYTGKINISSFNVPDRIINFTIEVLPDGSWYFT
ncbi:BspA family leucine-rich repeat surface protein, partial [archaeon]|nr:BspA family leucine-rich repeat surface protein [archaeon]